MQHKFYESALLNILRSTSKYDNLLINSSLTDTKYDEYYKWITSMLNKGKTINLKNYKNRSVLYMFIIDSKINNYENNIICKIGFTENIVKRKRQLEIEYKCKLYLIDIIKIKSLSYERSFHKYLKIKYSSLVVDTLINNIKRNELYIISPSLHIEMYIYMKKSKLYLSKF